jgi:hypothetical protein
MINKMRSVLLHGTVPLSNLFVLKGSGWEAGYCNLDENVSLTADGESNGIFQLILSGFDPLPLRMNVFVSPISLNPIRADRDPTRPSEWIFNEVRRMSMDRVITHPSITNIW